MKAIKFNPENLTPDQQVAVKAVENLCDKIRNHNRFSDVDIARITTEIKSIHAAYKKAFKASAFSWQVEHYMMQMALENEFKFIFYQGEKVVWTPTRWKFALMTQLGIRHYKQAANGEGIVMQDKGLELMALWLFFHFFKASVFTGPQCMEVVEMAFQIVKDADSAIYDSVQTIKQWRNDNDELIRYINYQKATWRRELARLNRFLDGHMWLKEVKLHHIFYWCHTKWTFEQNVRAASLRMGISEKGVMRILRDNGINKDNLWGYLTIGKEDADAKYEEELKMAEKVRSNTLTKKERKRFWRKHSIPNPQSLFRTFTFAEPDLIPAQNPLLTDETCVAPNPEDTEQMSFWEAGKGGYVSPFKMQPMPPCFNPMNTKSEKVTI